MQKKSFFIVDKILKIPKVARGEAPRGLMTSSCSITRECQGCQELVTEKGQLCFKKGFY